jgi:hypothetical protein
MLQKRQRLHKNTNRHPSPRSGTTFEHLPASRPPLIFHWSLPLKRKARHFLNTNQRVIFLCLLSRQSVTDYFISWVYSCQRFLA